MRVGTPGFVGDQLAEARTGRCMSMSALADVLGITRQAVSQYERGPDTPSPEIFEKICTVLNLPPAFFLRRRHAVETAPTFRRSNASATRAACARGDVRLLWLQDIGGFVSEFVDLPKVNFPTFDCPDPIALTDDEIEQYALETRRYWGLGDGPISNVAWLLENNGAVVARSDLAAETLDGLSRWSELHDRPCVILAAKNSAARSRFDAAHELGHLILHRKRVDPRLLSRPTEYQRLEQQAHRFAGAFLLPQRSFATQAYPITLETLRSLKARWRVSIKFMITRASHLHFISDEQARRLYVGYSRRGWHGNEPLDSETPPEEPRMLARSLELMLREGVTTKEQTFDRVPLSASDLEELSGLQRGFFSARQADVYHFQPKLRPHESVGMNNGKRGELIEFPGLRKDR